MTQEIVLRLHKPTYSTDHHSWVRNLDNRCSLSGPHVDLSLVSRCASNELSSAGSTILSVEEKLLGRKGCLMRRLLNNVLYQFLHLLGLESLYYELVVKSCIESIPLFVEFGFIDDNKHSLPRLARYLMWLGMKLYMRIWFLDILWRIWL